MYVCIWGEQEIEGIRKSKEEQEQERKRVEQEKRERVEREIHCVESLKNEQINKEKANKIVLEKQIQRLKKDQEDLIERYKKQLEIEKQQEEERKRIKQEQINAMEARRTRKMARIRFQVELDELERIQVLVNQYGPNYATLVPSSNPSTLNTLPLSSSPHSLVSTLFLPPLPFPHSHSLPPSPFLSFISSSLSILSPPSPLLPLNCFLFLSLPLYPLLFPPLFLLLS